MRHPSDGDGQRSAGTRTVGCSAERVSARAQPAGNVPGKAAGVATSPGAVTAGMVTRAVQNAIAALDRLRDTHAPMLQAAAAADRAISLEERLEVLTTLRVLEESMRHAGNPSMPGRHEVRGQVLALLAVQDQLASRTAWATDVAELAPRLGLGLGEVDVRSDDAARAITEAEGARGVARDNVVHLHPDRATPGTPDGREVLAHELVHLKQAQLPARSDGDSSDRAEAETEAAELASTVVAGGTATPRRAIDLSIPAADAHVQRHAPRKRRCAVRPAGDGGVSRAEALVASTDHLRLPRTVVGQSAEPNTVRIFNTGPVPVEIGDVRGTEPRTDRLFPVFAPALEPIEPGASIDLAVGFRPDRLGAHKGTLQILDGEGALAATIVVRGRGIKLEESMHRAVDAGTAVTVTSYADMVAALRVAGSLAESDDPAERQKASALAEAVVERFDAIEHTIHAASSSYGVAGTTMLMTYGHASGAVKTWWRGLVRDLRPRNGAYVLAVVQVAEEIIKVGTKEAARAKTIAAMDVTRVVVDLAQYAGGFVLGAFHGAAEAIADLFHGAADMIATVGRVIYKLLVDDWGGIRDMLAGWASKIEALIGHRAEIADAVSKRWNAANDWDRGLYQGEVLGWIMMTVVLIAMTMGAGAEAIIAQAGSRFGILVKALQEVNALGDAVTWAQRAVKLPRKVVAAANKAMAAPTKTAAVTGEAVQHVPDVDANPSTARSAGRESSDAMGDAERATHDADVSPPTDVNHGAGELDSLRVLAGKMSPGDVSEWEPLLRLIANLENETLRPAVASAQAAQKEIATLKAQLAAARRGQRFRLETKIEREVHAAIEDALHSAGVRDALGEHGLPSPRAPAAQVTTARAAGGRVDEPVPGLYDSVDPDFQPPGWTIREFEPPHPHPDHPELTQVTTEIWAPDGSYGRIQRSYDPTTKTLVMENAFLDKLPRWIDAGIPMVPGQGTNTVTYLTLRQMKLLEVGFSETRLVKMSTIQNIEAVMQLDQLTRGASSASPLSLQEAVAKTHSVQYATTSIEQSGQAINKIEINTDHAFRWNLTRMMDHFQMAESKRQSLFAKYGLGPNDEVLVNYDILIQVSPHPKNPPAKAP